ncbi:MAG: oligopeptide transporter, OPT family [Candidatus Marinimicrobia bacterium]|nr:oligopeptide transporter, OPT family [Candidatus Neomarinimicrobiota bacterium]HOD37679.1 oligopeptide transporter, OPT family [Candidatus Neomarinimicrobiota bacterium]HOU16322.1 oligopeptide transporter, OPT family [Candidatus Neomarinimicrobiota bacterium]HPB00168.1 oligopeptide transporter, OPT family [Candidatus Neomarinimicrobiota bacterium]HQC62278.1 oligopeptide transporter, OPT family [Candidatus Neomarinimicrobiota bacterium]
MKEFTIRSLIIGLIMAVVLGAANAYLGLKAGMTIAATYPAAVIGMAILRMMKGTILEENFARTVGSIGESVAAGAIFTIPAFYIAGIWTDFATLPNYLIASSIMLVGGVLGVLFVALLRRVMVEDVELPFPESVAAAEIHKAGQKGGTGAKFLFGAMGLGAGIQALISLKVFTDLKDWFITFKKAIIQLGSSGSATGQSGMVLTAPRVSPAYIGVGYIIGPKLASLNFSGGLLAWGLFVPILTYFIAPSILPDTTAVTTDTWMALSSQVWRNLVRPIAVGGMLMSAIYTLFKMRKSLINGLSRSISDVKKAAQGVQVNERTEQDLKFTTVMFGISLAAVGTFFIYLFFAKNVIAALVATVVMIIAGFFFAAVSGYLVGIIGSSNNPISGLTLSTLIVAALLMVALGMKGTPGVAAVLGVAGVVCVSAAVAGEMLQDLKVGHILGGTPWKMQIGDLIGVALSAVVMFIPLIILHQGDINMGGTGLGGTNLAAPQASLMAMLSQGIVSGEMAWPLIIVGILLGLGFILMQVKSPMLVCVGMYLGLETTFAIFVGGLIRGLLDHYVTKRRCNDAQKSRVENTGVLLAAGLIAGEALVGLLVALLAILKVGYDKWLPSIFNFLPFRFEVSLLIFGLIGWILVSIPLKNAGKADEPAPPSAVM